jgi:hypothetical protein
MARKSKAAIPKSPAPGAKPAAKAGALVKVRVLIPALAEAGCWFAKGDTFETTPGRAAALGDSVEPILPD